MAETRKPNTICRNPNCKHGADGGRKHFYACMTCLRNETWRSYCCCFECFEEYTRIVLDMRAKAAENNQKFTPQRPERTDMTAEQIENVMQTDVAKIAEYTKEVELKDYFEENPNTPLADIIDQVNEDIDTAAQRRRKKRKNQ